MNKNITFGRLVDEYLESPEYLALADISKAMYGPIMARLKSLGEDLAISDRGMQDRVARSRSPKAVAVATNLTQTWWKLINGFKMENGKPTTNATRNTLRTYLKIIYRWAINNKGYLTEGENPTNFKAWKHMPAIGNPAQYDDIKAIERSLEHDGYPEELKPYAYFFLFMYYAALRPMDMYNHKRTQFTHQGGQVFLEVWGAKGREKGSLTRYVMLDDDTLKILKYFQSLPKAVGHEEYTFRTLAGQCFCQPWLCQQVKKICTWAGIAPRALYDARRGIVTTLDKAGVDYKRIRDRVGHIKESTTRRYSHMDEMEKAKAYKAPWAANS
jgi:integrase